MGAERLLYRIALGSTSVVEASFDVERARFGDVARRLQMGSPLFVCGLARAGTTVLTRLFHASDMFASCTYRDLPFPLAPNVWRQLSQPFHRKNVRAERGHGDGILHDLDSPEAIEEVFWRQFCGDAYINRSNLSPHIPSTDVLKKYGQFIRLIMLAYGRTRYLAKNNNNILRLPTLLNAFQDSIAIIPYRRPTAQAASLLHQHQRSTAMHQTDPFRGKFMQWLGHHEFGSDHRPFVFDRSVNAENPGAIDYWMYLWIGVYRHLLQIADQHPGQVILVDYDRLCRDPALLRHLCARVGCPDEHITADTLTVQPQRSIASASRDVSEMAEKLYADLQRRPSPTSS